MEIHHLVLQSVSLSSRGAELLLCNLEEDGKHCDVGFCSAALVHFRQSGFDVMPKYEFGLAILSKAVSDYCKTYLFITVLVMFM